MITNAGTGWSACGGLALTRWHADPIEDGDGTFVYLRDLDSGSFWSIGYQPVGGAPRDYEARLGIDRAEISRLDDGIETRMEVCVSPDDDLELRRCTVRNTSGRTRRIEVTSYLEVVLADAAADASHPAFSKLFVQTEALVGERALVASRRPRGANERSSWLIHWLIGAQTAPHAFQYETDRQRFIGRAGSLARPQALTTGEPLTGTDGNVLDPIFSLRTVLELPDGAQRTVTFGLGSAGTRKDAIELASRHAAEAAVAAAFRAARQHARDELERLSITPAHASDLLEMTSALLYGEDRARATPLDRTRLAALGITATRPLVLGEITSRDHAELAGALATAQAFWQGRGLAVDLVLLIDNSLAGHGAISDLGAVAGPARAGSLIARKTSETSGEERALLEALAHVLLRDAWPGREGDADEEDGDLVVDLDLYRPASELRSEDEAQGVSPAAEELSFDNGYGGFTDGGREYLMHVTPSRHPPLPWTHVVANESFGFIASESGACFTWSQNSRLN
ncbi:MAG: hypothetical protein ACREH3_07450, partial [Geminicoccales bacterium]